MKPNQEGTERSRHVGCAAGCRDRVSRPREGARPCAVRWPARDALPWVVSLHGPDEAVDGRPSPAMTARYGFSNDRTHAQASSIAAVARSTTPGQKKKPWFMPSQR